MEYGSIHGVISVVGEQHGTVTLDEGAIATVEGSIFGTVAIASGAELIVEPTGRVAGTLSNYGRVIVRGVFGGAQSGSGDIRLEGHGYIKQPTLRNGAYYYEW